ncbi:MAG: FimV/HubP family polar landmark protein [Thiotrichaceae bacterium]|nr:FimV/HubP family polar landmark protein [Thiotrichaceae bacterium]
MGNSLRLVAILVVFFNIYPVCASTYGPVKAGDILWHIAAQVSPSDDLSRYQTMLALLKANPKAFSVSCNVNSLKIGAVLQIPSSAFIQATSAQQATKLINQQFSVWKNRRNVAIICEPVMAAQSIQMTGDEILLENINVIPTLKTPDIQLKDTVVAESEIDAKHIEKAIQDSTMLTAAPIKTSVANINQTQTSNSNEQDIVEVLTSIVKNNLKLLLIIGGISAIFVILLILMMVFALYKLANKKATAQEEPHSTVFSRVYEEKNIKSKPVQTEKKDDDVKDKLAVIRTCLAEGEEAVQVLLKDVFDKGSDEQQHEARQLIEINRKIHQLEQHKQHENDLIQVAKMSQYLPQSSFAPENKQQVFSLIDKIFELLDHELSAKGQLIEAYTQRHQAEFFDQNIRPEKILVEKDAEPRHAAHHSHSTEKATRYL